MVASALQCERNGYEASMAEIHGRQDSNPIEGS